MIRPQIRLFIVVLIAFLATGCGAYEMIAGVPAKPKALCRGAEQTNAADSTGTRALGSVYRVVECNNTTAADTVIWP